VREAADGDGAALVDLINAAYVVEASLVRGARIDEAGVREYRRHGAFLVAEDQPAASLGGTPATPPWLPGCVYVEPRGVQGYLGLLSVQPERQGAGLGDRLLRAGEARLLAAGCGEVEILVISERGELFPWYERRGYRRSGTRPFTDAARLLRPCHFVVMRKELAAT
jgi:GNAT superfamily N-acetyltransferase